MQKTALIVALAGLVAGCATGPKVIEGNEVSVVVSWRATEGRNGALEIADAHCAKFGRKAQFSGNVSEFLIAYNCVK